MSLDNGSIIVKDVTEIVIATMKFVETAQDGSLSGEEKKKFVIEEVLRHIPDECAHKIVIKMLLPGLIDKLVTIHKEGLFPKEKKPTCMNILQVCIPKKNTKNITKE